MTTIPRIALCLAAASALLAAAGCTAHETPAPAAQTGQAQPVPPGATAPNANNPYATDPYDPDMNPRYMRERPR